MDAESGGEGIDRDQIAALQEMAANDPDVMRRLVATFLETAPEQERRVCESARAGDGRALEENAHKLKGASLTMGMKALGEVCERLEAMGYEDRCETADSLLQELACEMGRAELFLRPKFLDG